jgi:hypothetical protein
MSKSEKSAPLKSAKSDKVSLTSLTGEAKIKALAKNVGITDTKEVMKFAVALVNAYRASIADGRVTGGDFQFLISPIMLLVPAFDGANNIGREMADLDDAEKQELANEFSEVIKNPLYLRLFIAVVNIGDAVVEIVQEGKLPNLS